MKALKASYENVLFEHKEAELAKERLLKAQARLDKAKLELVSAIAERSGEDAPPVPLRVRFNEGYIIEVEDDWWDYSKTNRPNAVKIERDEAIEIEMLEEL